MNHQRVSHQMMATGTAQIVAVWIIRSEQTRNSLRSSMLILPLQSVTAIAYRCEKDQSEAPCFTLHVDQYAHKSHGIP
jgi:hypothetical protein